MEEDERTVKKVILKWKEKDKQITKVIINPTEEKLQAWKKSLPKSVKEFTVEMKY